MVKSEKVLLICNKGADYSLVERALKHYSLTVVSAPELFSDKFLSQRFSLIFYHLQCPLFSEYEVAEILRKSSNFTKTPIIFLSESTEVKPQHQKAYNLSHVDFLYAPFSVEAIRSKAKIFFNNEVLRNSGEQFWLITETIPHLIWRSNPDGSADYFSQRFLKYVGYSSQEMLGWGWAETIHAEDRPNVISEWMKCSLEERPLSIEFRVKGVNGQYRWFMSQGHPFRDMDGNIVKYYGTWTDIDEQKNYHSEIEQALLIRDEFLSIASHELKTPLTSLKLQLQMTQRNIKKKKLADKPVKVEKAVDMAIEQVKRLENLVDSLLDITRIRSGKLSYDFCETNLSQIVISTVERFSEQFVQNKCPVKVNVDPLIIINCDPYRMEQVITNLLSNAAKYGQGKPIEIRLEKEGKLGKLTIKDHGIGIEKEKQKLIFERFERVASTKNMSGLGLGLFIVAQILNDHKATIEVNSELAKGATFVVEIPLYLSFHGQK